MIVDMHRPEGDATVNRDVCSAQGLEGIDT
jgi:hypothetical protein